MVTTTHPSRTTDKDIVVFGEVVNLTREASGSETEPWSTFIAGLIARREERKRAEAVSERVLALSLEL